ncbi:MAG: acyltransferase [Archangiaceae bacterium]|nr:acyltransferase [Archangiaceae bacterium]
MKWEWIFLASAVPLWLLATLYAGWLEKRFPTTVDSKGNHIEILEILRGIAAFVVFCAHVTMYFGGLAPGSRASSYMGDLGVIIFFMLTGFLFWGQLLSGRFSMESFFPKRIRRLVPLCVFVVGTVTLVDWIGAGFVLPSLFQLHSAMRNFGFGFVPVQDVFGPDMYLRINTIWSLRWEWLFYFLLPVFAVRRTYPVMTLGTLAIVLLFYNVKDLWEGRETEACFVIAFYLGAIGNLIAPGGALHAKLSAKVRAFGGVLLVAGFLGASLWFYFREGAAEARVRHLTFVLIASQLFFIFPLLAGFKVLTSGWFGKAAMHLGRISYSLYLWQLAVIYWVIRGALRSFDLQSGWAYAGVASLLALLVVTVSHFSYRHIELPFMRSPAPRSSSEGLAAARG